MIMNKDYSIYLKDSNKHFHAVANHNAKSTLGKAVQDISVIHEF